REDVSAGNSLAVARRIVRDIRRRIAALAERDAAMGARKAAHLRLPGAVVACELMDEDNGRAGARFFVIKIHAVAGFDLWHHNLCAELLDPPMLEQNSTGLYGTDAGSSPRKRGPGVWSKLRLVSRLRGNERNA